MRAKLLAVFALFWCAQAFAVTIEQPLPDAAQEAEAQAVFRALKCVVCEGQSLAESDAALAVQMRAHVREMAGEGRSEEAIVQFFRERYGDRIIMAPPVAGRTVPLWLAPILFICIGVVIVWRTQHKKGDGLRG